MFIHEIARLQAKELERQIERSARTRALLAGRPAQARWFRGLPVRRAHPATPRP